MVPISKETIPRNKVTGLVTSNISSNALICWIAVHAYFHTTHNHCHCLNVSEQSANRSLTTMCRFSLTYKSSGTRIACQVANVVSGECNIYTSVTIPNLPENNEFGEVHCNSTAPLDLSFVGYQLDDYANLSFIRYADDLFNYSSHIYSVIFHLNGISATRKLIFTSIHNRAEETFFNVFRPGRNLFSTNLKPDPDDLINESYILPVNQTELGRIQIPCIPNDRNVDLSLYECPPEVAEMNTTVNNWEGILINTQDEAGNQTIDPSGRYVCVAKDEETGQEESVSFQVYPSQDKVFSPATDKIYLLDDSVYKVSCRYSEGINLRENFTAHYYFRRGLHETEILQHEAYMEIRRLEIGNTGHITFETEGGHIITSWEVHSLDLRNNSVLQLNNLSDQRISCQSGEFPVEQIQLQMVFCQGETECKLNEFCFDERELKKAASNRSNCLTTLEGVLCDDSSNSKCLTLPKNNSSGLNSQGMIRCSVGTYIYQTNFFVGFDNILYLNWWQAPTHALIDVSGPIDTFHLNKSHPFVCRASKFLSDGVLQWMVRQNDGSDVLLSKCVKVKCCINRVRDVYKVHATDQDYQMYTVRESEIFLKGPNSVEVLCMVPKWNTKDWYNVSKAITFTVINDPDPETGSQSIIMIVGTCLVVIIVLLGVVLFVMWRWKMASDIVRNLTEKEVQEFIEGNPKALEKVSELDAHELVDYLAYDKSFEIAREKLLIDEKPENIRGRGAFGIVYQAKIEGIYGDVAAKTVNSDDCDVGHFKGMLRELKMRIFIGNHPNVVGLIGACTEKIEEKKLYIIVELCEKGSLESYLRDNRGSFVDQLNPTMTTYTQLTFSTSSTPSIASDGREEDTISTTDLIRWSYQVSHAMEYLAEKRVIHSDLAARNVLIDFNGNAKLTDFGLSRRLYDYTQYVRTHQEERLPWRWLAIESLKQLKFSTQSDIWGFGILLWEIYSLGDIPYPGIDWGFHFVHHLENGLRLVKPPFCTEEMYDLLTDCWDITPELRPSFTIISQYFKAMMETSLIGNQEQDHENVLDSAENPAYHTFSTLTDTITPNPTPIQSNAH